MKTVCKTAHSAIKIAFIVIFGSLTIQTIFFGSEYSYSAPVILALVAVLFAFVLGLCYLGKRFVSVAQLKRFAVVALIVTVGAVFIVQSFVSIATFQSLDHDIGRVFNGAGYYLHDAGRDDYYQYIRYFNIWPNNVPIFLFFVGMMSVVDALGAASYEAYYAVAVVIAQLVFTAAICLTFLYLRRIAGIVAAYISLVFWLIFPLVYLQGSVFYTDTYSLAFVPAILYLFERAKSATSKKSFWVFTLLTALVLFCGYAMKSTVLFVFIALFLVGLISKKVKKTLIISAVSAAVFFVLSLGLTQIEMSTVLSEESLEQFQMPATFWVAMGLGGQNGAYEQLDYDSVLSIDNQQGKQDYTWQLITERLQSRSASENLEFFARKLNYTFGSGDGDISYMLSRGPVNEDNFIYSLILPEGRFYTEFFHLNQSVYVLLCVLGVVGATASLRRRNNKADAMFLALLGFFLFMLFWESNQRQLVNQIPIYIALASLGLAAISPLRLGPGKAGKARPFPKNAKETDAQK